MRNPERVGEMFGHMAMFPESLSDLAVNFLHHLVLEVV